MSVSTFLNLCYSLLIILIMLASLNSIIFAYVQSSNTSITSKVIPYNSSALPLTNKALHIGIPKLSKVIPYNSSALPLTNTSSYTTTNATPTFSSVTLNGSTSKQFKDSIVPSTSSIINGVRR